MGKNQHVVKRGKEWAVLGEKNSRVTTVHSTQNDAFISAREIAINQQSEVFIHGRDGKIRDRNSYGKDNYPPKG